jgi:hypothetical protein
MPKTKHKSGLGESSSSTGLVNHKQRKSLTANEKQDAYLKLTTGQATPQVLANKYGCDARQFQKLAKEGPPKSSYVNKRNREPHYMQKRRLLSKIPPRYCQ